MSKLSTLTPIAAVLAVAVTGVAHAAENPFALKPVSGIVVADAGKEGSCGASMKMDKKEGSCGAEKMKAKKEGKCGEGKCGAKKKAAEEAAAKEAAAKTATESAAPVTKSAPAKAPAMPAAPTPYN